MYAAVGSFLGPCDIRISTRSPSFFSPPSWRRGKAAGAAVGVTWISHAKLRNAERAWNDPVRRPCLRDLGGLRSKRSVRSGAGAVHSCDWPGSRWNADERRDARPYCIYALSCPVRTPSGVSSRCAHWYSHGTVRRVERFFVPLVSVLMPIPSLAWVPVFILWFGLGNAATIALVFYAATFPVIFNTWTGVRSVNRLWIR